MENSGQDKTSASVFSPQIAMIKPEKRLPTLLALFLLFMLVVTGAGGFQRYQTRKPLLSTQPLPTPVPKVSPTSSPTQNQSGQVNQKLVTAHNSFGFKVFQELFEQEASENLFISPSSIALALSMTYNGAEAETRKAMAKTLGVQNMTPEELNQAGQALLALLASVDEKVTIEIANSIWAKKEVEFKEPFLSDNQRYYQAQTTSLDFNDPKSVEVINAWVSKNTKGKIPTIINQIPPEMVMYLINAIYFKGNWTFQFDEKLTKEREFTLPNGGKKMVLMMEQKETFPYFETEEFQAISLPYGENKRLRMDVFLPKNGLDQLIENLNLDRWIGLVENMGETKGTIILPKFKIEYEKTLNQTLQVLGMGIAFDPGQANFGRLADLSQLPGNLYLSEVKHKSFVEVNEEGTEAAAVTNVGIGIVSVGGGKKTFYLEVNRPFLFAIRDSQTNTILFLGTLQKL